jgi:hypothetical protein
VYFALPFETISPPQSRTDVMKRVLAYFGISVGVDVASSPLVPSRYELQQNFPNPFNPTTTIRYSLPSPSRVKLTIYDMLGQRVAELVNTEQDAGFRSAVWNASVASGIYFYRIDATAIDEPTKHFVDTKKMLLLR